MLAAAMMRERGVVRIMWGDGLLVSIAEQAGVKTRHPLDRMTAVLNALERSHLLFRKMHIRAHDSRARPRLVRMFELVD